VLTRPAPPADRTVAYGPHPDQVLDLRAPAAVDGGASRPLVIVVHGGFWRAEYDRTHTGPLAAALAALGYPVAQIEYRRTGSPGGGWPGTLDDALDAVRAAPAAAAALLPRFRADAPVLLLGHSAGGQLALWCAARAPELVAGVLALAPVADLARAYRDDLDDGAVAALLGGGPQELPERYAATDPVALTPIPVRTVVVHGLRDEQVPPAMSRSYVAAARAADADVQLIELPECEHFGLIDPLSPSWSTVVTALQSMHDDR